MQKSIHLHHIETMAETAETNTVYLSKCNQKHLHVSTPVGRILHEYSQFIVWLGPWSLGQLS